MKHPITACLALLVLALPAAADDITPIFKGSGVEVNLLSDFESGTRFHNAGNIERAIVMFRQGAEKGDPRSQFALATYYYFAEGVEQDYAEALRWLQPAAAKGSSEADFLLAKMYEKGRGVPADDARAVKHLLSAARACVPQAQAEMADRHFAGRGVARDDLTGLAWLVLAGEGEGGDQEARKAAGGIVRGMEDEARQALKSVEKKIRGQLKCSTLAR